MLPLTLSFVPGVWLMEQGEARAVLESPRVRIPFDDPSPGLLAALRMLAGVGATEDQLAGLVLGEDGSSGLAPLYYCLERFSARLLLRYTISLNGAPLATLTPIGMGLAPARTDLTTETRVRLSRFACCRRDGDELVLETPLAPARVTLHGPVAAATLAALAQPVMPAELAEALPALDTETACALLQLLKNAGVVAEAAADGTLPEDENVPLRQWEFHDLLFHSRSREGRHDGGSGGTFRFLDSLPPLPAVKPPMSSDTIELPKPDLDRLAETDVPLARALETRRSVRAYGTRALTLAQLGEFLYRTASVRAVTDADPSRGSYYPASRRPYPSGGATYDLELYLSVSACDGLDPGLYHYDPLGHRLERLSGRTLQVDRLLAGARRSSGISADPPVLITLASRFQRLAWKYQSMAYATVLKNAGVLYQTMYLVATAMGLAPCGLGGGDADLFVQAAGTDYYAETSVGEFMLGSL